MSEKLVARSSTHLVPEVAGQGQTRGGEEAEGARRGPGEDAHPDLPRGNLYQQHCRHAVQEGLV